MVGSFGVGVVGAGCSVLVVGGRGGLRGRRGDHAASLADGGGVSAVVGGCRDGLGGLDCCFVAILILLV